VFGIDKGKIKEAFSDFEGAQEAALALAPLSPRDPLLVAVVNLLNALDKAFS